MVNKPLIQYGVEEAMAAGITGMAIVTGRGKRAVEDHFDISYELEHQIQGTGKEGLLAGIRNVMKTCTFSYTRQMEMKGLGHAVLTGEPLIGNEPFAVVLADDFCVAPGAGVLAQMIDMFSRFQCSIIAVEEVPIAEISRYGVVAGDIESDRVVRVREMVEKPDPASAPGNLAIIGRYILTPDIFELIRTTPPGKNGEMQITDALLRQAQQGRVIAYRFQGQRFDCGSIDGYVAATNYVYQHMY